MEIPLKGEVLIISSMSPFVYFRTISPTIVKSTLIGSCDHIEIKMTIPSLILPSTGEKAVNLKMG